MVIPNIKLRVSVFWLDLPKQKFVLWSQNIRNYLISSAFPLTYFQPCREVRLLWKLIFENESYNKNIYHTSRWNLTCCLNTQNVRYQTSIQMFTFFLYRTRIKAAPSRNSRFSFLTSYVVKQMGKYRDPIHVTNKSSAPESSWAFFPLFFHKNIFQLIEMRTKWNIKLKRSDLYIFQEKRKKNLINFASFNSIKPQFLK